MTKKLASSSLPPPSHHNSRERPVSTRETVSTRTEVVARTTNDTTMHALPLPGREKWNDVVFPSALDAPQSEEVLKVQPRLADPVPVSYSREKALPPTPSASPARERNTLSVDSISDNHLPVPHSTSVLAQAALSLGLPHVMPHMPTPVSPVTSGFNTLTIGPDILNPRTGPRAIVRRSKSSQRLEKPTLSVKTELVEPQVSRRRTRGISLGPMSFFNFQTGSTKGNEKERSSRIETSSPRLSRKNSFWSRKKSANGTETKPAEIDSAVEPRFSPSRNHRSMEKAQPRHFFSRSISDRPNTYHEPGHKFLDNPPATKPEPSRPHTTVAEEWLRSTGSYPPRYNEDNLSPKAVTPRSPRPQTSPKTLHSNPPRPQTSPKAATSHPQRSQASPKAANPPHLHRPQTSPKTAASYSPRPQTSSGLPRLHTPTKSPLLHRLSLSLFSTPTSSPVSQPPSAISLGTRSDDHPRSADIPRPLESEESPDLYLSRLRSSVNKSEIVNILSSSSEFYYAEALKAYINGFDFVDVPLDIALRKLLMETSLPKESQQIDRVIEAFSKRYIQCNPNLFTTDDHPYILAFSLIMLHTDAFNKSNKWKMTKADYIKNTRLPGIADEMLDYFYDNIVFAPFIFIEDPMEVNDQRSSVPDSGHRASGFREVSSSTSNNTSVGTTLITKINRIDPYYMIVHDLLSPLRVDITSYLPLDSPYEYGGIAGKWNGEELLHAFTNAQVIEVGVLRPYRSPSFFNLTSGSASNARIHSSKANGNSSTRVSSLRIAQIGLLDRKDDIIPGGRKATSRKWRQWGVILTGSQLLFSRDQAWINAFKIDPKDSQTPMPQRGVLQVDELLSVKNAVAVFDRSYTKHRNTFRVALSDGRHMLLRTSSEDDMNRWITRINYASTFKSAGIRMRSADISAKDLHLTGVAAATSHLHDMQTRSPFTDTTKWDDEAPEELLGMLSGEQTLLQRRSSDRRRRVTLRASREGLELEEPIPFEKTPEFKDTFYQVKADLAAEGWMDRSDSSLPEDVQATVIDLNMRSFDSLPSDDLGFPSRTHIIQAKIAELDVRLKAAQNKLDVDMQFVRNVTILTPFQRATRDRLAMAIQGRTQRIMQLRLDIVRLSCHRNVLQDDMTAEVRVWSQTKNVALRAAKETLSSKDVEVPPLMPRSLLLEDARSSLDSPPIMRCRHSKTSICESFHTAVDVAADWRSTEDLGSPGFLGALHFRGSSRSSTSGSQSTGDVLAKDEKESEQQQQQQNGKIPRETPSEEEEEAEAWQNTRCAHRVSLVRVPSSFQLPHFSKLADGLNAPRLASPTDNGI